MQYYSTNHLSPKVSFKEAMLHSEAADGGLYMPEKLPVLPKAFINNIADMSIGDLSYILTSMLFAGDLPADRLKRIGDEALAFPMPLKEIEPGIFVMELFHGPTQTVKDIGARFLARTLHMLHETSPKNGSSLNVLISTNGNSGNAVANVFNNIPGVNVFALYPRTLQVHQIDQLNSYGDNIHAIGVNGHLDTCASMVNRVTLDPEMGHLTFTSANSFNIGHLMPYTVIHFNAVAQLLKRGDRKHGIYLSIPTGSGGNLCSAYMASIMGLPVSGIIAACNENSGFPKMLERGIECHRDHMMRSLAYALDTPRTPNMPRLLELCEGDLSRLRRTISADVCTDPEIRDTIDDVYERTGYMLDPHSAVAYSCLKKQLPAGATGIFYATSSPNRSADVFKGIVKPNAAPTKSKRHTAPARANVHIPPTYGALKRYLINNSRLRV